jgi:hypothetical protein
MKRSLSVGVLFGGLSAAAVITGCRAVGLALLAGIRNGFQAGGTTMGVATAVTEVTGDSSRPGGLPIPL